LEGEPTIGQLQYYLNVWTRDRGGGERKKKKRRKTTSGGGKKERGEREDFLLSFPLSSVQGETKEGET